MLKFKTLNISWKHLVFRPAVTSYFVGFVKMDFEKCFGSNLTCEQGRDDPRVSKHLFRSYAKVSEKPITLIILEF